MDEEVSGFIDIYFHQASFFFLFSFSCIFVLFFFCFIFGVRDDFIYFLKILLMLRHSSIADKSIFYTP